MESAFKKVQAYHEVFDHRHKLNPRPKHRRDLLVQDSHLDSTSSLI